MTVEFAPKDAETLKLEILEDLSLDEYEGNEETVDKVLARRTKDEEFKASLHTDKNKHLEGKKGLEEKMRKAGLDPETGGKLQTKVVETETETPKNDTLSPKDYLALTENKVGSEDFDEVMRLSKVLDKPIFETLKDSTTKLILKNRLEERETASATETKKSYKKSGQSTGDRLINDFEKGNVPDTEEDTAKLAEAQFSKLKGTK